MNATQPNSFTDVMRRIFSYDDLLCACEQADEWHDLVRQNYPDMYPAFRRVRAALVKAHSNPFDLGNPPAEAAPAVSRTAILAQISAHLASLTPEQRVEFFEAITEKCVYCPHCGREHDDGT